MTTSVEKKDENKMKKMVSRYNINLNKFEIGYWHGTTFVVVSTAAA